MARGESEFTVAVRPAGAKPVLKVYHIRAGAARYPRTGRSAIFRPSLKLPANTMGYRLSKIYTRTGDSGETGLGDGSRVSKDGLRVSALGDIDELNSSLGVLLTEPLGIHIADALQGIQHDLFDLGGEVCIPGRTAMTDAQVSRLEQLIDTFNADLAPLKEFILPGGTRAAALAHLARAICRRAERSLVALARAEATSDLSRIYLNRLSDLLFVLARTLNDKDGDVLWQQNRNG